MFVPSVARGPAAKVVTALVIIALAALNVIGVKPGARLTIALTIGKLVPLAVFAIAGLFAVESARFEVVPESALSSFPAMALTVMFAYQGFEVVGVTAGEVKEPRLVVPKAVVASILLATALYLLVQIVFVGVGGSSKDAALPEAARIFLGTGGAALLGAGGLVSMLGFNAGTALSTPRYLQALAEEGLVPPVLARQHERFLTPAPAIVTTSLVTLALGFVLDFEGLVDFAVLAVLCQYFAASAALVRLGSTAWKKTLGAVSLVISVVFLVSVVFDPEPAGPKFLALAGVLVLGIVVTLATRAFLKRA
jgi:amino acid transporter